MTGSRFDLAYIELTLFIDVSASLNMTKYILGDILRKIPGSRVRLPGIKHFSNNIFCSLSLGEG
jgi:hypothetical protein